MIVILLALANTALLRHSQGWRMKLVGGASIGLWLSAIVLGRLVGYF
jgi:hypothetical protein